MNLPNKLTILRMILIVPFVACMLIPGLGDTGMYASVVIFIIASLTDLLDGKIARKYNLVTNFGKFMDPLADKLLVAAALICLTAQGSLAAWISIIIISREFIISGFRLIAADNNIVIAANYWGKIKTVVQMVMCVLFIVDLDTKFFNVTEQIFLYASVALTVISLCVYIYQNRHVIAAGTK